MLRERDQNVSLAFVFLSASLAAAKALCYAEAAEQGRLLANESLPALRQAIP